MLSIFLIDDSKGVLNTIGLFFIIPSIISLSISKFMNKSIIQGQIHFGSEDFILELKDTRDHFSYKDIYRIDINNYNGQQYFSFKDIYPFHDGEKNYVYIKANIPEKVELKIKSKWIYTHLRKYFNNMKPFLAQNIKFKTKKV
jgi:hypothetical protein